MAFDDRNFSFLNYDHDNCRAYYRHVATRELYCIQDETAFGRPCFRFYRCSRDGEPSHEPSHEARLAFGGLQSEYEARSRAYQEQTDRDQAYADKLKDNFQDWP